MSKRKKRTKTKQRKTSAAKKVEAKQQEEKPVKDEGEEFEDEEFDVEEVASEEDVEAAEDAEREDEDDDEEASEESVGLLALAQEQFDSGNYRAAQDHLVSLLESSPTPEEQEQAQGLMNRMEIDVRTLMVGAVGMVTILMIHIPSIGFMQALWTIPVLFLLLLLDPRLFRSPESTD